MVNGNAAYMDQMGFVKAITRDKAKNTEFSSESLVSQMSMFNRMMPTAKAIKPVQNEVLNQPNCWLCEGWM
jgi:hypothetical protein